MGMRWLVATMVTAGILYLLAADGQLDPNGDSPRFVMLARNLASGGGYVVDFTPEIHPESQIPYGYPLLLTPAVLLLGPRAYAGFELISLAAMVLAVWASWIWLRQWMPEWEAPAVVTICALLAECQTYAVSITTEASYLAASFLCLWSMEKITTAKAISARDWGLFFILLGVAFHLRIIGIALLLALCIALIVRQRWLQALLAAIVGALACAPWLLRLWQHGLGYAQEFEQATPSAGALIYRVGYNAAANIAKSLPDLFTYPFLTAVLPYGGLFPLKAALGLVLFGLITAGFWRRLKPCGAAASGRLTRILRDLSVSEIYFLTYLAICTSWTTHGDRYLLPVVPVLVWLLLKGAGRYRSQVAAVLMIVGFLGCSYGAVRVRAHMRTQEELGFLEAASWLREHAAAGDLVMSRHPAWIACVNGQRGIRWEDSFDADVQRRALVRNKIRWVVIDHNKVLRYTGSQYLAGLLERYPGDFALRYQSAQDPPARVYEFTGH